MKVQHTICDVCGQQFTPSGERLTFVINQKELDICGQACALKKFSQLMSTENAIVVLTSYVN